ncbi:MAG: heme biosynthesis HemY N-terminal domain-containing protein [Rhizobiaceae bacterium]
MFRIAVFILLLFALAFGFAWLADNPGTVTVQWDWLNQGQAYEFDLITLIFVLAVLFLTAVFLWWCFFAIINSPKAFGRWRAGRRRDKGYVALSKGLVAAGAGNVPLAKQLAKESGKLLDSEPLVAMLEAQTALLEDDRPAARQQFNTMLENNETRLLGLRGLYLEAEKEGAHEAAAHFAKEANDMAPGTPWAANAVLKIQIITGQWEAALKTLDQNRSTGIFNKPEFNRKKAVVLTALALQLEDGEPEKARIHALAASKLAKDLAPAATVAARLLVRLDDQRKAGKILEAAWQAAPHPEIADAYGNLVTGDTVKQRLARMEKLIGKKPDSREGKIALAQAAADAGDFKRARDNMEEVLRDSVTEGACLLMADIEEAEYGDRGRVREWLSRAVSAAKDPAWMADGVISEDWLPCSPTTGHLDAFEWKAPIQQLTSQLDANDVSLLVKQPLEELPTPTEEPSASVVAPTNDDLVVDAEIVEENEPAKKTQPKKSDKAAEPAAANTKKATAKPENDNVSTEKPEQQKSESTTKSKSAKTETDPETDKLTKTEQLKSDKKSDEPTAAVTAAGTDENASPYTQADLDPDQDGVIDHRPDDPGISEDGDADGIENPQKKGWLF